MGNLIVICISLIHNLGWDELEIVGWIIEEWFLSITNCYYSFTYPNLQKFIIRKIKLFCNNTLIHPLRGKEKRNFALIRRHHFLLFPMPKSEAKVWLICTSVWNHTLSFLNKAIACPVFIRLQTLLHSFSLLDCFPLPPNQIRVGREIWKRSSVSPKNH